MVLSIGEKLNRGIDLLEDASNDQDLLGVAMLTFQAAMRDHLIALSNTHPDVSIAEQSAPEQQNLSMPDILDLAQQHGDLTREQRWRIEEAEKLLRDFIAGESFRGSLREVRSYGHFVATLSGDTEIASYLAAAPQASAVQGFVEDEEPPNDGLYQGVMRWLPGLALVAILMVGVLWLLGRANNPLANSVANVPANTRAGLLPTDAPASSALTPTLPASLPTAILPPGARTARIVRLGGGPGWLHETADFASPTIPIRLSEGQPVIALGQQQQDADGNPWVLVLVSGYQGWSPLNNVEYDKP